ncbi:hypothetical protein KZ483_02580 [Paenibacillus sp. sptzw28]|uniref:hypothetical protein n=1 Tax=Paenibacillus sp. sptzw28 TaxID=715179 RepID=UPI001C6E7F3D|nr:hypothetical protein [Paenibacillus sp. sptzw28]QYR21942.1 hypothetical protein KZ483_02580 [Paenibacillus sp. sptzw28]
MLRKSGDFEQPLTEEEILSFKQSMFDYVGKEFPMNLEISNCCALNANITGKITKIEGDRILVIDDHKKNGNTDNPYAVWLTLTEDGKILHPGKLMGRDRDKLQTNPILFDTYASG